MCTVINYLYYWPDQKQKFDFSWSVSVLPPSSDYGFHFFHGQYAKIHRIKTRPIAHAAFLYCLWFMENNAVAIYVCVNHLGNLQAKKRDPNTSYNTFLYKFFIQSNCLLNPNSNQRGPKRLDSVHVYTSPKMLR